MLNFAIVGWPRCGTSSLYKWLNDHPDIEGSTPKEPFYLMDEDHPLINGRNNWHKNREKGLEKFFSLTDSLLKFEATTHYFYQETALKYLKKVDQKAIVIFVVRDPGRRILSSFNYTKENLALIKKEFTFNQYVRALFNGNKILDEQYLSGSSLYIAKRELELSDYSSWLQKWEDVIGKDRMLVLKFEMLKKNPFQLLKRIGAVVGFDASFYESYEFTKMNKSVSITNYRLHRFMLRINRKFPSFMKTTFLKRLYFSWQDSKGNTEEDDYSRGLQQLQKYFSQNE